MTNFHGRILLVLFSFFMVILSGCGIFMGRIPAGTIPGSIPQDHVIELGGVGYHYREYPAAGPDVVLETYPECSRSIISPWLSENAPSPAPGPAPPSGPK